MKKDSNPKKHHIALMALFSLCVGIVAKSDVSVPTVNSMPSSKVLKRDITCMSDNIYYEASTQSIAGKIAVGEVVLNRTTSGLYPKSVCKVIWQHCQFSWTCMTHLVPVVKNSRAWKQSQEVAKLLLRPAKIFDITDGAMAYHTVDSHPAWASHMHRIMQIDQHVFYRLNRS